VKGNELASVSTFLPSIQIRVPAASATPAAWCQVPSVDPGAVPEALTS
jgi:hypothetical protein